MKACPICGTGLQRTAVHETYYSGVELAWPNGMPSDSHWSAHEVVSERLAFEVPQEMEDRIYCENDHTLERMFAEFGGDPPIS